MSKVLHLTRWKDKGLAEREEFSDEEDSEDEESDVEDITIPVKSRERKITSSGKKAKKPRLQIPEKYARKRRARKSLPVHLRAHLRSDHAISRKRRK